MNTKNRNKIQFTMWSVASLDSPLETPFFGVFLRLSSLRLLFVLYFTSLLGDISKVEHWGCQKIQFTRTQKKRAIQEYLDTL